MRIGQIATVDYDPGQTEIDRDGLRQTIAVTARLEGRDLGSAIRDIQPQLAKEVHLPAGHDHRIRRALSGAAGLVPRAARGAALAIALVFLVLVIEFRSFAHPTAIVSGAVLALSGSLGALLVTHTTLNVVSMMGMIMIVGIVSKNGILDARHGGGSSASGRGPDTRRCRDSGRRRFRPVLMTSLAAMLGMLPLALALGSGAELLQPLAICVIGAVRLASSGACLPRR